MHFVISGSSEVFLPPNPTFSTSVSENENILCAQFQCSHFPTLRHRGFHSWYAENCYEKSSFLCKRSESSVLGYTQALISTQEQLHTQKSRRDAHLHCSWGQSGWGHRANCLVVRTRIRSPCSLDHSCISYHCSAMAFGMVGAVVVVATAGVRTAFPLLYKRLRLKCLEKQLVSGWILLKSNWF